MRHVCLENVHVHVYVRMAWPLSQDDDYPIQDVFWPIPGLISCAGVTESVGTRITHHACATQMAGHMLGLHSHTAWQPTMLHVFSS